MFLGLPDLLVRGTDPAPDPDPSIIKQKIVRKILDSYCFVTFLWLFTVSLKSYVNVPSKSKKQKKLDKKLIKICIFIAVLKAIDDNGRIWIRIRCSEIRIRTEMSRIGNTGFLRKKGGKLGVCSPAAGHGWINNYRKYGTGSLFTQHWVVAPVAGLYETMAEIGGPIDVCANYMSPPPIKYCQVHTRF
jgi:hypothetical protein